MKYYCLQDNYVEPITLDIKPGMVLAVYTDKGPKGICVQSCSVTCNHTYIYLFENYDKMTEFIEKNNTLGRPGHSPRLEWAVVGSHSTGNMQIRVEEDDADNQKV